MNSGFLAARGTFLAQTKQIEPALDDAQNDPNAGAVERGRDPENERVAEKKLEKVAARIGDGQFAEEACPGRAEEEGVVRDDEPAAPMVVIGGPQEIVQGGREGKRQSEKKWFEPAHDVRLALL